MTGGCDEPQQSLGVSAKWIKLPFDKRFAIYDEVLQLFRRRQFRNVAALRRVIQERHKVKISYYTIHKWVRGIHDPRNRFNILTGIDANLCYIVGATLSDGHCFAHPRNRAYRAIILSVKDYGFALAFATAAKRLFRKQGNYTVSYTQERYHVKVTSVMLYDLISAGIDALRSVVERYPASFIPRILRRRWRRNYHSLEWKTQRPPSSHKLKPKPVTVSYGTLAVLFRHSRTCDAGRHRAAN